MKKIEWNALKSDHLKKTRGVSFEDILDEKLVAVLRHPTRLNQQIMVYEYKGYCWAVPCIVEENRIFLKTIYPSRKLTRHYKRREIG